MLDSLNSLPSEPSTDAPVPAQSVSLVQLQSSGVRIDWYEAVAIIQELGRAILESGDEGGPAALAAAQVIITSSGKVSSTASGRKDAQRCVQQVGELLQAILPEAQFPTTLRLVISQAVSTPPLYSSIREFSKALEYFERPNRTAMIQAVYQRWKTTPVQSVAAAMRVTPAAEAQKPGKPTRASYSLMRIAAVMSSALVVGALVGIGAWVFGPQTPVVSKASSTIRSAGASALETATSAVDALLDRVLPKPVEAPPTTTASAPAKASSVPARRSARAPVKTPPLPDNVAAFDLERSKSAAAPAVQLPAADGSGDTVSPVSTVSPDGNDFDASLGRPIGCVTGSVGCEPAGERPHAVDPVTYAATDRDVVPPVAIYPQLPSELPHGVRIEDLATIELIVTDTGNVESVRVREAPQSMSDGMFVTMGLSAAKTWRFQPALRSGQPVKYRKAVWILTH